MDIRNLRTFIRVAELSNFTKAAQSLGYSQSAVTVQMQQLETEIGLPLFDRIGKNIKLNQYGMNFIDYATAVIEAMEKAEAFSTDAKNMKGYIRFGVVDSILNACFISILPEFNRRFPHINVSVFVGSARDIENRIRANELDFAYLLDYKVPRKEWVRVREEVEPIIFVANPKNRLAVKKEADFEELINEPLILMPPGEGYRYLFDDELTKRNLLTAPSIEIANTEAIIKLTLHENYITMLPVFAARSYIKEGLLKEVNIKGTDMKQWSQLIYLKGKAITPQMQLFMDTVLELLPPINQ
ncbi:MAG: LysR family transcriptional regulator [Oscillospiraceae bacterium]|nr:LysR family transcriptional regulator [Oscillospiraceae bacterium]